MDRCTYVSVVFIFATRTIFELFLQRVFNFSVSLHSIIVSHPQYPIRLFQEMASHQETIFDKYFGVGARGGAIGLELPQYAVEHTEVLYAKAKRRPIGYMFDVAQAFVYQVWSFQALSIQ